jgi:RNA polymerase sigma-70 factor, ECF subfamily
MPIDSDTLMRTLLTERAKVLAYIRAIVRRREWAEDIFQDVCVLALEKQQQIVDERHLLAWMRTTARLRAMNLLRKRDDRLGSLDDRVLDLVDAQWTQQDTRSGSDLADALAECVRRLTERARALLQARYTEGLTVEQIARQAGRPVASVYVTFSRIHSALSDCVFGRPQAGGGGERG